MKSLLTIDELICHMKEKGIKFNLVTEESAHDFLMNSNYYMKLASYRSNYQKYPAGPHSGKYMHLEFAYLKELSTIDMHLRYIIFQMTLDIEHYLKVKLLNMIESNPKEDGYLLIQKFISQDPKLSSLKKIQSHKASDYCKGLIEKYYPYFPAWVFVELISFGELAYLCEFYRTLYNDKVADRILLNSVRDIRNACAHSNCLINVLTPGNNKPHNSIVNRVKSIPSISENVRDKKLSNKFIYDFICLLYAYNDIVSSRMTKHNRYVDLKNLFENRMLRHQDWFTKNNLITSSYSFIKKVLDTFETIW
mgnify:CR=1 FL=1